MSEADKMTDEIMREIATFGARHPFSRSTLAAGAIAFFGQAGRIVPESLRSSFFLSAERRLKSELDRFRGPR